MRKIIHTLIYFFTISVAADVMPDLLTSRGFLINACFRHRAIRQCPPEANKGCTLELFSDSEGKLTLSVSYGYTGRSKVTTKDYGFFTFQRLPKANHFDAKILEIERVPLEKWLNNSPEVPLAKQIDCPLRGI